MKYFIETLKQRNETLYWFGLLMIVLAIVFFVLAQTTSVQVKGVNAWIKPFKFAASTVLYAWAMAWYCHYLQNTNFNLSLFNWIVVVLLGFEVFYIALQAGRGQLSHFNMSSSFYATMFSLMGLAATIVTAWTAYIGFLFFIGSFPELPPAYLWAIRLGILLFVIFAFEGFLMGSRLSHSIGGPDTGGGIPILNWSRKYGDARVAHFIGMHALQVLPIVAFYLLRNVAATLAFSGLYGLLAVYTLWQALQGRPIVR